MRLRAELSTRERRIHELLSSAGAWESVTDLALAHDSHQEAMESAEAAFLAERRGAIQEAWQLYCRAFRKESEAATALASHVEVEPTRSVLYRSAASLALKCGERAAASHLAAEGLAGQPPEEIADELRSVLSEANSRIMSLSPDEWLAEPA